MKPKQFFSEVITRVEIGLGVFNTNPSDPIDPLNCLYRESADKQTGGEVNNLENGGVMTLLEITNLLERSITFDLNDIYGNCPTKERLVFSSFPKTVEARRNPRKLVEFIYNEWKQEYKCDPNSKRTISLWESYIEFSHRFTTGNSYIEEKSLQRTH